MGQRGERRQKRRGADEWQELIADWKSSGKGKRAWCAECGVSCESLRRWAKRLHPNSKHGKFVEVSKPAISVSLGTTGAIRIMMKHDIVIELAETAGDELLKRVLAVALEAVHVS
jgi:hypothetical protein